MRVLETERLALRWLTPDDAGFILGLLNEPSWLRFIGDKGVRTLEDARGYIARGPGEMYARLGFGLFLTERKADGVALGLCGLIKRDSLDDVDVGYAFLPAYWGQGYAREAARAVTEWGFTARGLDRIVAITLPDNAPSIALLESIGFELERAMKLPGDGAEVALYARHRG